MSNGNNQTIMGYLYARVFCIYAKKYLTIFNEMGTCLWYKGRWKSWIEMKLLCKHLNVCLYLYRKKL